MVTNRFLNNPDNTDAGFQEEFDRLTIESIQATGHDVVYIPRTRLNEDDLWGEDPLASYADEGCIEMYIESVDGFDGDKDFISKFGLELRDEISLLCSITRWQEECIGDLDKPRAGDLIYFPLSKDIFEVRFVDDDHYFYSQNRNFTYRLKCEKFDYSFEEIDTDVTEINDMIEDFENDDSVENDTQADNDFIEDLGSAVKDFSEEDPFGSF